MNTIKGKLDKSDYENYNDFMNFEIDGIWLDEMLDNLLPNRMFKGLIPTLNIGLDNPKEKQVVWERIVPTKNKKSICPVLMCPDDCDFVCTLIVVEIENSIDGVKWNRMGLDNSAEYEAEKIGTTVEWFKEFQPLMFNHREYEVTISDFREQYKKEKLHGR